jgi:hypothetical protein
VSDPQNVIDRRLLRPERDRGRDERLGDPVEREDANRRAGEDGLARADRR